jgi:hypothetical protein
MQRQARLERVKPIMWIGKSGPALCMRASHGVEAPLGAHQSQAELGRRRAPTAGLDICRRTGTGRLMSSHR